MTGVQTCALPIYVADDGVLVRYYHDGDGDGAGDPGKYEDACEAPAGHVANSGDCDDNNPAIRPEATEVCDNLDNNCDGQVDEGLSLRWFEDGDGDGHGSTTAREACAQPEGYVESSDDCNDGSPRSFPGNPESCDLLDNDCNGQVDEGLTSDWYADADGDGYGSPALSQAACVAPSGYEIGRAHV